MESNIKMPSNSNPSQDSASCHDDRGKLLAFIRSKGLETPALVLLELYRPLVGIGDALIIFSQPFLKIFSYEKAALDVLRSRDNIDWLISELERPLIQVNDRVSR